MIDGKWSSLNPDTLCIPPAFPLSVGLPPGPFADAFASALRGAGRGCGAAQAPPTVDVAIMFGSRGEVMVTSDEQSPSPSERCVVRALEHLALPPRPAGLERVLRATVVLPAARLDHRGQPARSQAHRRRG